MGPSAPANRPARACEPARHRGQKPRPPNAKSSSTGAISNQTVHLDRSFAAKRIGRVVREPDKLASGGLAADSLIPSRGADNSSSNGGFGDRNHPRQGALYPPNRLDPAHGLFRFWCKLPITSEPSRMAGDRPRLSYPQAGLPIVTSEKNRFALGSRSSPMLHEVIQHVVAGSDLHRQEDQCGSGQEVDADFEVVHQLFVD